MHPVVQHRPTPSDGLNSIHSEHGGEQEQEQDDVGQADIQPLRVIRSMDGNDWRYTTAVLTTMTLGITMLFFERGFLEGRDTGLVGRTSDFDMTSTRIIRSLILLGFAMAIGMLSWLLLMPNLQAIDNGRFALLRARKWILWSTLGFAITNIGAVINGTESESAFKWEREHGKFVSPVAHYFLMVVFFAALIVADVLFVTVVLLPFVDGLSMPSPSVGSPSEYEFRIYRDVWVSFRDGDWDKASPLGKGWLVLTRMYNFILDITSRLMISLMVAFYQYIGAPMFALLRRASKVMWRKLQRGSQSASNAITSWAAYLGNLQCSQCLSTFTSGAASTFAQGCTSMEARLTSYVTENQNSANSKAKSQETNSKSLGLATACWILKTKKKLTRLRSRMEEWGNQYWDSIKEDENFQHSSWVKASVLTSVILLFYFGFTLAAIFQGAFKEVYKEHRDCALDNPKLADFFLRSAGFGETSLTSNPSGGSLTDSENQQPSLESLTNRQIIDELVTLVGGIRDVDKLGCLNVQDRQTQVLLAAVVAYERQRATGESISPSDHFSRRSIGESAIVMDEILHQLDWSIWCGFVVGLVIGVRSLMTIFAQYKRVATALRTGFFDTIPEDLRRSLNFGPLVVNARGQDPRWNKLLKVYQLSKMVFFTGMLVSTAVLQLVVFGALVSLLVALVASLFNGEVLRILAPVLIFFATLLIAWLVNNVIATTLAENLLLDGYIIRHELTFLFYSLVFSMIHLVLGVLLAMFRLLILLLSTLSMINRLDINLFITWQFFDVGHRSFIAMTLLNHANELSMVCSVKPSGPTEGSSSEKGNSSRCPGTSPTMKMTTSNSHRSELF